MLSQEKADGELLELYGKVIAIILLIVLLGILGFRHFGSVNHLATQGLRIDHTRLINVLGMIKAQWLAQGRPQHMRLDWDTGIAATGESRVTPNTADIDLIQMSSGGWPLAYQLDPGACEQLWYQLLGLDTASQEYVSFSSSDGEICSYSVNGVARIGYNLSTGSVVFLTSGEK